MACGFGACFGCVVPTRDGYVRLCVDGPVLDARAARAGLSLTSAACRCAAPVLNGSGTFDAIAARRAFGDALLERFPFDAFVSKTITLEPRQGNPPPRLWETPAGLINSIGLPNKGLEGFLASDLPELAELPVPLVVSVMGFSRDELATLVGARRRARRGGADRAERVLPERGDRAGDGRRPRRDRAGGGAGAPARPTKPLIVKLTPNAERPRRGGRAPPRRPGADAVSLINTLKGMALDPAARRPWLGGGTGGVSGPGGAGDRPRAGACGGRRGRISGDRHGRDRLRARRGRLPGRGRRLRGRRAPRASATPPPGAGSRPSWRPSRRRFPKRTRVRPHRGDIRRGLFTEVAGSSRLGRPIRHFAPQKSPANQGNTLK